MRGVSACEIGGAALAVFVLGQQCFADTIRLATWNLEPATVAATASDSAVTNEIRIQEAAAVLKRLDPDVILLQQVRDWRMCGQLVQALKPAEYSVSVCSSFREAATGHLSKQQVAVLSKWKAYFSWSEPWRIEGEAVLPGGFAFAALQIGKQRVGFFSVQAEGGAAEAGGSGWSSASQESRMAAALQSGKQRVGLPSGRAGAGAAGSGGSGQSAAKPAAQVASIGQLLEQVRSVDNWVTNRVQVLVVAGTFDSGAEDRIATQGMSFRLLDVAGFGEAFLETPVTGRFTRPGKAGQPGDSADYIFTKPLGCASNPRILSAAVSAHAPVACDVELDPAVAAAAQASRVAAMPAREQPRAIQGLPAAAAASRPPTPGARQQAFNHKLVATATMAGIVTLFAAAGFLVRRRRALSRPPRASLAVGGKDGGLVPSSYTFVVGTRSGTETAPAAMRGSGAPQPIIRLETPGATQTRVEVLRQRALAAEQRADRANAVIRGGLIPYLSYWLKHRLVQKLIADRAHLLETQQAATFKVMQVEERLVRIEQQIQRQNASYQERIEALTRELIVAKQESRELIRERIAQVKAEMEAARARLIAQSDTDFDGRA